MKFFKTPVITIGLAIFAMLFGAGNLIFPVKIGITGGTMTWLGALAFLITGVVTPIIGLVGIALYDGDYNKFFDRLGKIPGELFIFLCMLIIGPLLVMPRIIDSTYDLARPFIGNYIEIYGFSALFSLLTFICTYKENSLLDLIGKFLSPIKLTLILGIILYAVTTGHPAVVTNIPNLKAFFLDNFMLGYNTLDLLGSIFFGHIIMSILKETNKNSDNKQEFTNKQLASFTLKASLIGGALLMIVYLGMAFMGAYHGQGLEHLSVGKMFIQTALRALNSKGAFIITLTVFVACLTTMIALTSVVSEYITKISRNRISYVAAVIGVLFVTMLLAFLELEKLMDYSEPLIFIIYPALIVLTLCNIAYKLWGFKPVKIPVLLTLIVSTYFYGPKFIDKFRKPAPEKVTTNSK